MLRDRLPRDVEVRGDPPRGQFLVADETQDLTSPRLNDGINGCLHANVSIYYRNLTLAQVFAYIDSSRLCAPSHGANERS